MKLIKQILIVVVNTIIGFLAGIGAASVINMIVEYRNEQRMLKNPFNTVKTDSSMDFVNN
jgi:uncharacterized membrane protein YccC